MKDIQRYDIDYNFYTTEDTTGRWVKFEDIADLKKELDKYKNAYKEMREDIIFTLEDDYPLDTRNKYPRYKQKYDNEINWLDDLLK